MSRLFDWFILAGIAIILTMAALVLTGCKSQSQADPAPQTSTAPAQATATHLDAAGVAAEATVPFVQPAGKTHIERTIVEVKAAKVTNAEQIVEIKASNGKAEAMSRDLVTAQGKVETEHTARVAAEEKYDNAWFGGRFWFWFDVISWSTALLFIGGLILNHYTDFFLTFASGPLMAAIKVAGAIIGGFVKFIAQGFTLLFSGIGKLFAKSPAPAPVANAPQTGAAK